MLRTHTSLGVVLVLMGGCAANPNLAYHDLQQTERSRVLRSPGEAIHATRALKLDESAKQTVTLERSDPVVALGAYSSFFKVLEIHAVAATSYRLTVRSACHCAGKPKTLVVPRVFLLDDNGTLLAQGPSDIETRDPSLTSNLHARGTVEFKVPVTGDYYLLVAADNSRVGAPVESVKDEYIPDYKEPDRKETVEYDILSSPVGKITLELSTF